MYLLNGESKHFIDFADRGFQYGDGLFETIEVQNGIPLLLDCHLARLQAGCERLLISGIDFELLEQEMRQFCIETKQAVLKLIVTRGKGGRGYRLPKPIQPTRLLSLHPYPDYPDSFYKDGVVVRLCQLRLGCNPALAGMKHLNRLEQVLARAEWDDEGIQEGLLLDCTGAVIEGTMSNVFFVSQGVLITPVLDQCGVRGVVRDIIIALAKKLSIPIHERACTLIELQQAEEIFLTNSIIGLWPVRQLQQKYYSIGSITRKLQSELLQFKMQQIHYD
jgi:4-amino-4-deoxychorismate lyase